MWRCGRRVPAGGVRQPQQVTPVFGGNLGQQVLGHQTPSEVQRKAGRDRDVGDRPTDGSRGSRRVGRLSGVLGDRVDLVGDQTVGLSVHRVCGLGIGSLNKAKDLAGRAVDPVAEIFDPKSP